MGKSNNNYIPELLLPVGGKKQLIAAVENGADAVYLGGNKFNARINAENFSERELENAVRYAHSKDVKVYITINTLLFDDELFSAFKYAEFLYKIGVDALIIQDLGFAKLMRDKLPDFELHLSTQASIYNLSGVEKAKELGFSRVVLARENTLKEIGHIANNSDMELEIFVHGAMCICYSGQCHLSREIGGRSGNRGVCAQPCRMKYHENKKSGYFLSPKDLSTIHYLDAISNAKITSLKIEGRMKSFEYVAVVCQIYRKYLDEYEQNGKYRVSQEDERNLAQIFNRGNFSTAYYFGRNDDTLMSKSIPKHQGIYIGKALNRVSDTLLDVKLKNGESLKIGDGVEFRNLDFSGNVISYCRKNVDGSFRIGDISGKVNKGDCLYKISDKEQLEEIRNEINAVENGKAFRKSKVNMHLIIKKGEFPTLQILNGKYSASVKGRVKAEKALKVSITEEKATAQLKKLGDTSFVCENIICEIDNDVNLQISILNEMRREAVNKLIDIKQGRRTSQNNKPNIDKIAINNDGNELEIYFHEFGEIQKKSCKELLNYIFSYDKEGYSSIKIVLPIYDVIERNGEISEFVSDIKKITVKTICTIPYVFPITKGKQDEYLKKNEKSVLEEAKLNGIYVGNLGSINFFKGKDIKVFADYGFNICNGEALKLAKSLGMEKVFLSHEINQSVCGNIPLMISEHIFDESNIEDRKQKKYEIRYLKEIDKTVIYNKKTIERIFEELRQGLKSRVYI